MFVMNATLRISNDIANAIYTRHEMLILIVGDEVHSFTNIKEFRKACALWHDKPHVAFTVRNGISAQYINQ